MCKPRPIPAALLLLVLFGANGVAFAQPIFSRAGAGSFSTLNTSLLVNDAAGQFQTQGTVLCQAPETGQLTSPSGVCMQYTPSVGFIGGAAAIFGLKGATADYVSPPLTTSGDTPAGSSTITVQNQALTSNISTVSTIGAVNTLSTIASSVAGALPAGETILSATPGLSATQGLSATPGLSATQGLSATLGPQTTLLRLSAPTQADLPPGSTVTFTTNTSAQQFTSLAASADLTAHQAPGTAGQAWAANFIVQAEPGSSGLIHGIEIDAANFSTNVGGFGVWLGNNGNQNMNAGLFVGNGVGGKGWLYAVQSVSAVTDDFLSVSSATNYSDDRGSHAVGSIYEGTYGTAILQAINPTANTPTTKALFTITPKGGMVDSSPTPVGVAASGSTQSTPQGSTGMILVCSGTLATVTVVMPPNPLPKQPFHIASECTVSAIAFTTVPGLVVLGANTTIAPSTPMTFVYDNDRGIWLRW